MDPDNKHIARRKFVELSTIGLGGLMIGPAHAATLEKSVKPGAIYRDRRRGRRLPVATAEGKPAKTSLRDAVPRRADKSAP